MISSSEKVLSGFQIDWVTLRDLDSGEILWHGNEDYSSSEKDREMSVNLPKKMFKARAVSREIHFSSVEGWENLKLVQTVLYKGIVMDECSYEFGSVIPDSKNTWQSIIEAAPEVKMMTVEILSGNIVILSKFYNDDALITTSKVRLFYV